MIGKDNESVFTIIEGNHRFTAVYIKSLDKKEDKIFSDIAYLGLSPQINNYPFHIGKFYSSL